MSQIAIGQLNHLQVMKVMPNGLLLAPLVKPRTTAWLAGAHHGKAYSVGDTIDVFIYTDSEEHYLATTQHPRAMIDEIAYLKVLEINQTGAFLDWGIPKDLLLPYGEQKERIQEGRYCTVFIHKDKYHERIVASQRFNRHIGKTPALYRPGEEVQVDVVTRTDLGYKVVVNHSHWGLLYENEVYQHIRKGQRLAAWVKRVVADNKVDLQLSPPAKERVANASEHILHTLQQNGGYLGLHDKSSPEDIREVFGISKKNFKAALGKLYKARQIVIENDGIHLADLDDENEG